MKKFLLIIIILGLMAWGAYFTAHKYSESKTSSQMAVSSPSSIATVEQTAAPVVPEKIKETSFVIAGDVMLDRNVWHKYKGLGLNEIVSNLDSNLFKKADISLLNLEGPISSTPINDDWQSGSMVFNFPPESIDFLKYLGVKSVSLANNHSSNAGKTGFAYTQKILKENKIANFGRQTGFDPSEDVYRADGDIPVSIIGLDALADYVDSEISAAIKQEKAAGRFVILMPHWGTEYRQIHDSSQKALATGWIADGADMIVGSHPHVVEDFEVINGVPVVYSLGNFIFDQMFSPETQHGLVISGAITKDKITLTFLPTKEVVIKPQVLQDSEKTSAISKIFEIDSATGFTKISDDTIEIKR